MTPPKKLLAALRVARAPGGRGTILFTEPGEVFIFPLRLREGKRRAPKTLPRFKGTILARGGPAHGHFPGQQPGGSRPRTAGGCSRGARPLPGPRGGRWRTRPPPCQKVPVFAKPTRGCTRGGGTRGGSPVPGSILAPPRRPLQPPPPPLGRQQRARPRGCAQPSAALGVPRRGGEKVMGKGIGAAAGLPPLRGDPYVLPTPPPKTQPNPGASRPRFPRGLLVGTAPEGVKTRR